MDKCKEFYGYDKNMNEGECWRTERKLICNCGGDINKCTFYPEKRKENKTMNTAEMWTQAQENGKTYQLMNEKVKIYYRKDKGIFDSDGHHVAIDRLGEIDTFMSRHWQETTPILTKSEAEAKFGIKIVGD